MGEVLKFVTSDVGLRKKTQKKTEKGLRTEVSKKKTQKIFCAFCKNNSVLSSFWVRFRFKRPVLNSAKRVQDKHEKNWRARAKLLDFFLMMLGVRPRKEVKIIYNLPSSKH